jgi:alanine dehydrogenase
MVGPKPPASSLSFTRGCSLSGHERRGDTITGVLGERSAGEPRVAVSPEGVEVMTREGHTVLVEKGAGEPSGFQDIDYIRNGAEVVDAPVGSEAAPEIIQHSEMLLKMRESQPFEYKLLQRDQVLLCFLHLANSAELTHSLVRIGGINNAYETVQKADGSLPLLKPMSEVAGAMAVQQGAKYLEMAQGGHGIVLRRGVNVVKGKVTYKAVADAFGLAFEPVDYQL